MKGFRKNIKLKNQAVGFEQRQDMLDDIDDKGTYLPRGIDYESLDNGFVEFVEGETKLAVGGDVIPVIFLTLTKWGEFSKTWQHADEYKNIKMPFITVVKKLESKPGTNQNGLWNEDGVKKYIYQKVPTWDGSRKGVDIYKIPQPTSVDVDYEVRLFTESMRDLNQFNKQIQILFQSRQHYINIKAHPMPIHLEGINDESKTSDIDKRRYYIQSFEMKLLGYLLNEDDYEVVPTVNRVKVNLELVKNRVEPVITIKKVDSVQLVNYNFVIKPETNNRFKFTSEYDIYFNELLIDNLISITIKVNNKISKIPFSVKSGDIIKVEFHKNFYETSEFTLNGRIDE